MAKFRLQSVLDLKRRLEEVRQQHLARLIHERELAQDTLRLLGDESAQQQAALTARLGGGPINPGEVHAALAYIEVAGTSIAQQHALLDSIEQQLREARERLAAAARERQAFERLRDRQLAAAAIEAERRDQRAVDELVGQRYARRTGEVLT